jgi:uncharacterized membrane protein (UPF0127 family)
MVFLLLVVLCLGPSRAGGEELSEYGNPFTWVALGQVSVKAEVVKTPEKVYLGLSYRKELPEGRGLLFVMPQTEVQSFCMRGMLFPIDIIWLMPGKVVGIEKNVSPQFQGDLVSPAPVKYVLEVPGGFADKYGLKAGDKASW